MKDRRAIAVLVVVVGVMIGGAIIIRTGNDVSRPDDISAPTETSAGPTATTAVIPSRSREDFDTSVRRVTNVENQLFGSPDPSRVGEIMTADCPCYGQTKAALTNLSSKGWHVKAANLVVETTSVFGITGDEVEGVVELSTLASPAVDQSGRAIEKPPTPNRQPLVYKLKKGQDGVWRISDRHLPEEVF